MFQCFVQAPDMSNEEIIRGTNLVKERIRRESLTHEVFQESPILEEELENNQVKGIYASIISKRQYRCILIIFNGGGIIKCQPSRLTIVPMR